MNLRPLPVVLSLTLLLALGCGDPADVADGTHPELEAAVVVYQNEGAQAAIVDLEKYCVDHPDDATGWIILGNARLDLDLDAGAVEAFDKALAIDPDYVNALTGKGIVHRRRGELDQAMAAYRRAVEIDETYAEAWSSMAVISMMRAEDDDAVKFGEKAFELQPDNATCAANLAAAYHYAGREADRNRMAAKARELGYGSMSSMEDIFRGEMTLRLPEFEGQ